MYNSKLIRFCAVVLSVVPVWTFSKVIYVNNTLATGSDMSAGAIENDTLYKELIKNSGGIVITSPAYAASPEGKVRISNNNLKGDYTGLYARCTFSDASNAGLYKIIKCDAVNGFFDIDIAFSDGKPLKQVVIGGILKTIAAAFERVQDGDIIRIAGGPYTENSEGAIINCTKLVGNTEIKATYGSLLERGSILVEGVSTETGLPDWKNKIVIDCRSQKVAYGIKMNHLYHVRNFEVIGASEVGIGSYDADGAIIEKCIARDCNIGLQLDNSGTFVSCVAYANKSRGFDADGEGYVIGCVAINNGKSDFYINYGYFISCIAYNDKYPSTLFGFDEQWSQPFIISNCTAVGNQIKGSVGMRLGGVTQPTNSLLLLNNIITGCDTGVTCAVDMRNGSVVSGNLFYNNSCNTNGNLDEGYDLVESPVEFRNSTGFVPVQLSNKSPAVGAGLDAGSLLYKISGTDIGALSHTPDPITTMKLENQLSIIKQSPRGRAIYPENQAVAKLQARDVNLQIYNLLGRVVRRYPGSINEKSIERFRAAAGCYMVRNKPSDSNPSMDGKASGFINVK